MPLRDQITPVAEPPVTPAALRRLLIDAGARPTDLVNAKTGAVFETTAEILKAAILASDYNVATSGQYIVQMTIIWLSPMRSGIGWSPCPTDPPS